MKTRFPLKTMLKWIFLSFCLFYIYNFISIYNFSQQDYTQKSDVAIVLGAAITNDEPSPVFRERINHAILLYEKGMVSKIIFTGGKSQDKHYSESEVAQQYAIKHNVKPNDIIIEEKSTVTDENLKYAKTIMDSLHYKTALIVSDPLHMKRAIILAKDNNINSFSSPTKTSMISSNKEKIKFIFRENFFYTAYLCLRIFN